MKKTRDKVLYICGLLLIFAVAAALLYGNYTRKKEEAHRAELQAMTEERRKAFKELLPGKLPGLCKDLPVSGSVTAKAEVEWDDYQSYSIWTDTFTVRLETNASFDAHTDREKYDLLAEWASCAWDAYNTFEDRYLAPYEECMPKLWSLFDKPVSHWCRGELYIRTPGHSYQYANYVEDYYVLDGRDHFLRDRKSVWYKPPTPTPAARRSSYSWQSSGTYKVYDPYDADDYDDPDDYAEEYEEEFGGGDDGYEDAYDHWIEWHEEHG